MYKDETFNTLPTTDETAVSTTEDNNNTADDVIDVEFNDPAIMGDEFEAEAEDLLANITEKRFIQWMAERSLELKARVVELARRERYATMLLLKLDAQTQTIVELLSTTSNQSTHK